MCILKRPNIALICHEILSHSVPHLLKGINTLVIIVVFLVENMSLFCLRLIQDLSATIYFIYIEISSSYTLKEDKRDEILRLKTLTQVYKLPLLEKKHTHKTNKTDFSQTNIKFYKYIILAPASLCIPVECVWLILGGSGSARRDRAVPSDPIAGCRKRKQNKGKFGKFGSNSFIFIPHF